MTDSDTRTGRPPDAPPPGPEWKKIPDVKDWLEFSHRGKVRSLAHTTNGHDYEGTDPLKPRRDGDGYFVVNITMADGTRKNGAAVARLVLLAHDPEGYRPGLQACHGPGGQQDNRWPENLRWDTDEANRADWRRDNPPKPKPLKTCPRCSKEHDGTGRNCHECVVQIGKNGALYLAEGMPLDKAADALSYPPAAVFNLAVRYGGMRCIIDVDQWALRTRDPAVRHPESPPSWLRRVLFRREASHQNSDAR